MMNLPLTQIGATTPPRSCLADCLDKHATTANRELVLSGMTSAIQDAMVDSAMRPDTDDATIAAEARVLARMADSVRALRISHPATPTEVPAVVRYISPPRTKRP